MVMIQTYFFITMHINLPPPPFMYGLANVQWNLSFLDSLRLRGVQMSRTLKNAVFVFCM